MIAILTLVLGLLVGLYVSHKLFFEPQMETEVKLRMELGKVRGELHIAKHGPYSHPFDTGFCFTVDTKRPPPAIKTCTHSKVLPFDSIDDLIKGTKP